MDSHEKQTERARRRRQERQQQAGRQPPRVAVVSLDGTPADGWEHAYFQRMMLLVATGQLRLEAGEAYHVIVRHDDDCGIFRGGVCGCSPDFEVLPA